MGIEWSTHNNLPLESVIEKALNELAKAVRLRFSFDTLNIQRLSNETALGGREVVRDPLGGFTTSYGYTECGSDQLDEESESMWTLVVHCNERYFGFELEWDAEARMNHQDGPVTGDIWADTSHR